MFAWAGSDPLNIKNPNKSKSKVAVGSRPELLKPGLGSQSLRLANMAKVAKMMVEERANTFLF